MEKIYNYNGELVGYVEAGKYLMKHYYHKNNYNWVINKDGRRSYSATEFYNLLTSGEIIVCNSFEQGKKLLKVSA